jgi:DNA-binding response OmpR family regulator
MNIYKKPSEKALKVLVIDDNKDTTELLKDYFDIESIECNVVNDGMSGLEELRRKKGEYDFILLDITMPEFSGVDVFNKLKEESLVETKNIVIFTASSQKENEMLMDGVKYVLRKPFSLDDVKWLVDRFKTN